MPWKMETRETAAQRLQRQLKEQIEKFKKTPFVIPVAIALSAALFFLVTAYAGTNCLAPLLPPLALLGLLWYFDIRTAKKMLLIGVVASLVFVGIWVYVVAGLYENVEHAVATSEDAMTLTNGTISPLKGNAQTTYYYNITVRNGSTEPLTANSVKVVIVPVSYPAKPLENHTMKLVGNLTTGADSGITFWFGNYSFNTTIPNPINSYYFLAEVDQTWVLGADYSSGAAVRLVGPIFQDTGAVASALMLFGVVQIFASTFPIYAIMVLMIWWTRRARRMREDQMKKWQEEREKEEAKEPVKGKAKPPSLQKAMGLDEETFVCSECGADVPADATVCPKCGEKFE